MNDDLTRILQPKVFRIINGLSSSSLGSLIVQLLSVNIIGRLQKLLTCARAIAESRAEIRSFFSASRRFTFSPPSPDVVLSPLDDNAALAAASFSFSSRRVAYTCIIGISTVDL